MNLNVNLIGGKNFTCLSPNDEHQSSGPRPVNFVRTSKFSVFI